MKSLKPTRSRVTCSSSHLQQVMQGSHLSPSGITGRQNCLFFPLVELLMMFKSLQPHRMYFPLSAPRQEAATARPTLTSPVKHSNRSQQYRTSLVTGNQQRYWKGIGSGIKARDGRIYFPQSNSCSPNTISFNNITLNTPDSLSCSRGNPSSQLQS